MVNKFEQKLKLAYEKINNTRIYPLAVVQNGVETKRTEYQDGWNACMMEMTGNFNKIYYDEDIPYDSYGNFFLTIGSNFFDYDDEDGKKNWYIFLNDTWYYACADAEEIPEEDYKLVIELFKYFGELGLLFYVYKKRGHYPSIPEYKDRVILLEEFFIKNNNKTRYVEFLNIKNNL